MDSENMDSEKRCVCKYVRVEFMSNKLQQKQPREELENTRISDPGIDVERSKEACKNLEYKDITFHIFIVYLANSIRKKKVTTKKVLVK